MYANARLLGKFIVWLAKLVVSRVVGRSSFVASFFRWTKLLLTADLPGILMAIAVIPATVIAVTSVSALTLGRSQDDTTSMVIVSVSIYGMWAAAALISILWDKFIAEYERSFTILKNSSKENS